MAASLSALVWDHSNGRITQRCSISVYGAGTQWFRGFLIAAAVIQAIDANLKAEPLAKEMGADVDTSDHPTKGQRQVPGRVLGLMPSILEAGRRLSLTAAHLKQFVAMQPCPWEHATRQGMEVTAQFPFFGDVGPAEFVVTANVPHPQLGPGVLLRLALPNIMDPTMAVQVANVLNEEEASGWADSSNGATNEPPHFVGAWCQNNSKVSYATFLPAMLYRPGLLELMAYSTGQRVVSVRDFMLEYSVAMASSELLYSRQALGQAEKRTFHDVLADWLRKLGFPNSNEMARRVTTR